MVSLSSLVVRRQQRSSGRKGSDGGAAAPLSYSACVSKAALAWATGGENSGDDPNRTSTAAALRLLRCFASVLQTTSARRHGSKLQELVLDMLKEKPRPVTASPTELPDFMQARQNFWQCMRASTQKWEGPRSVPQLSSPPGSPAAGAGGGGRGMPAAAVAAGHYATTSIAPYRKPPSRPLQGAHRKLPRQMQRERFGAFTDARLAAEEQLQEELSPATPSASSTAPALPATPAQKTLSSFADRSLRLSADAGRTRGSTWGSSTFTGGPADLAEAVGESYRAPATRSPGLLKDLPSWKDFGAGRRLRYRGIAADVEDPCGRYCSGCKCCDDKAKKLFRQSTGQAARPQGRPITSLAAHDDLDLYVDRSKARKLPSCGSLPVLKARNASSGQETEPMETKLDPVDPPWARLPIYPVPYSCSTTIPIVQTGIWRYLQECQRTRVIPRLPSPLLAEARGEGDAAEVALDFRGGGLCDAELASLQEASLSFRRLGSLDLSNNGLSDAAITTFLAEVPSGQLHFLDLSCSGAGRLTTSACAEHLLSGEWTRVKVLRLRGCSMGNDAAWDRFTKAILDQGAITELCLADTNLGNPSQSAIRHVADMAAQAQFLEDLDLSGNFLLYEGCEALAAALTQQPGAAEPRARRLRRLDVSHNSWTHAVQERRVRLLSEPSAALSDGVFEKPNGALWEDLPSHNPLALLCEALAENRTLRELRLAQAGVDYSTDCVLLAALLRNKTLIDLDLSNNPHGKEGLKVLMRLVSISRHLLRCHLGGLSDASRGPGVLKSEPFVPSGHFQMELTHPQHRAVLLWLLHSAEEADMKPPQKAFTVNSWSREKTGDWSFKRDGAAGGWATPTGGFLDVSFEIPLALEEEPTAWDAVCKWGRSRRLPLSLERFVRLFSMYEELTTDGQREAFVQAMGEAVQIKTCQLVKLLKTSPTQGTEIARHLYGNIYDRDPIIFFDILDYRSTKQRFRVEAHQKFNFNVMNPTNRYTLDLAQPLDRMVAEHLFVVNAYESARAEHSGQWPDVSQHGNWDGTRNITYEGKVLRTCADVDLANCRHGILHVDYASPPCASPSRKAARTTDIFFDDVLDALQSSCCSHSDRVSALRHISEHLVLSSQQVLRLVNVFPDSDGTVRSPKYLWQLVRKVLKRPGLAEVARGDRRIQPSCFGGREFESVRAEALVLLFNRCCESWALCTADCIYDWRLFSRPRAREIRERLGRLRTHDVLKCCEPWRVCYGLSPAAVWTRPVSRGTLASSIKNQRNADKNSLLQNLRKLLEQGADPEAASFEMEPGRRYELRLDVFEERTIAQFLLALNKQEGGDCIVRCSWSERARLEEDGYDFLPPPEWADKGPETVGTLRLTYMSNTEIDVEGRTALAERFCGWEKRA
eukprot:TRINITY_DN23607_c0_g3_i3.p1 TRINITY_DN23607_c0_g3~~TRINITY_DN23607_c0_g3_i3.p1  ORF type:complete len:1386 (+),score=306.62 TRINITY_DN23607_c0_g3_i3:278-4435(+)